MSVSYSRLCLYNLSNGLSLADTVLQKSVMVYNLRNLHLGELLEMEARSSRDSAQHLDDIINMGYLVLPVMSTLSLNMSAPVMRGAFKRATWADLSPKLADGGSVVVAKQAIDNTIAGTRTTERERPYEGVKQLTWLSDDIKCMVWANAMQKLVVDFIQLCFLEENTLQYELDIPKFSFVAGALGVETKSDNDKKKPPTWIIEERVDEEVEGPWRKYVNNDRPRPIKMKNSKDQTRAEFLCFSQHVQYMLTNKSAFVSDYQGLMPSCTTFLD